MAWLGGPARRCLRARAAPGTAQGLQDVELCRSPWLGSGWQAGIAAPFPAACASAVPAAVQGKKGGFCPGDAAFRAGSSVDVGRAWLLW